MNLYAINFRHYAPKGSKEGTICLVLANSNEQVYEWLSVRQEANWRSINTFWLDDEGELIRDWETDVEETSKDRKIRLGGDYYDNQIETDDLYYGKTLYGWELLVENTTVNYIGLLETGFMVDITNFKRNGDE